MITPQVNVFVLSYNPLGSKLSNAQLTGYIEASRDVYQWYSPYLGTFYLRSTQTLVSLSNKLRGQFSDDVFTLAQVTPAQVGGFMPAEFWTWINGTVTLSSLASGFNN